MAKIHPILFYHLTHPNTLQVLGYSYGYGRVIQQQQTELHCLACTALGLALSCQNGTTRAKNKRREKKKTIRHCTALLQQTGSTLPQQKFSLLFS